MYFVHTMGPDYIFHFTNIEQQCSDNDNMPTMLSLLTMNDDASINHMQRTLLPAMFNELQLKCTDKAHHDNNQTKLVAATFKIVMMTIIADNKSVGSDI